MITKEQSIINIEKRLKTMQPGSLYYRIFSGELNRLKRKNNKNESIKS